MVAARPSALVPSNFVGGFRTVRFGCMDVMPVVSCGGATCGGDGNCGSDATCVSCPSAINHLQSEALSSRASAERTESTHDVTDSASNRCELPSPVARLALVSRRELASLAE